MPTMLTELNEAFDRVAADISVRAAVLTGAGRAFSAGARELSLTARQFNGIEAVDYGLAARSHPAAELDAAVDVLLKDIVSNSRDSHAAYKDLYQVAEDSGLRDGLSYEATTDYEIADTEDRIAGFR